MLPLTRPRIAFALLATLLTALPLESADIASTSDVLAKRGGAEITEAEVDARMQEIPEQQRAGFIDSGERIDTLLNQMLLVEQMAAEARRLGLDKTDKFRAARKLAEDRDLALFYQQHLFENAPKFDAETLAAEAFAASPKDFLIGDVVDVRHVLIKTDCRAPGTAKALAEKLRERAMRGESVADLARKYSEDDASSAEGGLFRNVPRGKTVKAFEDAAFAMHTPGELSPVIETPYGYHFIEMVEHRTGRAAKFEEIREGLVRQMKQRHQGKHVEDQSDRLLSMPLEGNPARLQALRKRYGDADIAAATAAAEQLPAPLQVPKAPPK